MDVSCLLWYSVIHHMKTFIFSRHTSMYIIINLCVVYDIPWRSVFSFVTFEKLRRFTYTIYRPFVFYFTFNVEVGTIFHCLQFLPRFGWWMTAAYRDAIPSRVESVELSLWKYNELFNETRVGSTFWYI